MNDPTRRNRLEEEESPYLRQHADNPVNWQPWDEQALEAAKERDVPIFLSIGYSACHWCHVMEAESFEDESVAEVLNENFVPIKVDREERPDVDSIYMTVCQLVTGRGGWPLSAWLTPRGSPSSSERTFPERDSRDSPAFSTSASASPTPGTARTTARRWNTAHSSGPTRRQINSRRLRTRREPAPRPVPARSLPRAMSSRRPRTRRCEAPTASTAASAPARSSPALAPARARSSVRPNRSRGVSRGARGSPRRDVRGRPLRSRRRRLPPLLRRSGLDGPHFEKMLYDNAEIPRAFLAGYQLTGEDRYAEIVADTLTFVTRELTHDEGGFFSTLDAQSESPETGEREEGAFYVWTPRKSTRYSRTRPTPPSSVRATTSRSRETSRDGTSPIASRGCRNSPASSISKSTRF